MNKTNLIMCSDSYKYTHYKQYPNNIVNIYNYAEARSNKVYEKVVFFGLQYIIKNYLTKQITMEDVEETKEFIKAHGIYFNYEDWKYIVEKHNGYLPIKIKAVTEGSLIPTKMVLFTIEATDKKVCWLVGFLETLLMKVWYSCNIATRSYYIKELLKQYANISSDDTNVDFQFHNFGDRGSSSVESAAIGGMAHLTQFLGTDNFNSLKIMYETYKSNINEIGFSIPASEHSTTISWGQENEFNMLLNYIENHKNFPIIAGVGDSYDIFNFVDIITSKKEFTDKINSNNSPVFVIRPDSGNPIKVINKILDIMEKNKVPYTINSKGFKYFNKYRIIWGDGINDKTIKEILDVLIKRKYSSLNIAFGSGGWLMQQHNRDTLGFAIKSSNVTFENGKEKEIFKNPITDKNKISKKGKVTTYFNEETKEFFVDIIDKKFKNCKNILTTVFENGKIIKEYSLKEVRENINLYK